MTTPGIGARLGSTRTTRASLTPLVSRELATAMHWWFFGSAVDSTRLTPFTAGLCEVTNQWSGSVALGTATRSVSYTPKARTSVVEILDEITRRAARVLGGVWAWSLSSTGVVTVAASIAFQLVATGVTRARFGFTGLYAGAKSYTAAAAADSVTVPSAGVMLEGAELANRSGATVTAGGGYATGLTRAESGGTLTLYGAFDELVELLDLVDDFDTLDVFAGGSIAGRVVVQGISREPFGARPDQTYPELEVTGVTL